MPFSLDKKSAKKPLPHGRVERADYEAIANLIEDGSRVLDLGCGDGSLMSLLKEEKGCRVTGIEIDKELARQAISKGLSVLETDFDEGLRDFPNAVFDVVVLSQTIQVTRRPHLVLREMLRVGKNCVVSVPNFGHWEVRVKLLLFGRMPLTKTMPYTWYETPNIHMVTVADFRDLCAAEDITIQEEIFLGLGRRAVLFLPNIFARTAIFNLCKKC